MLTKLQKKNLVGILVSFSVSILLLIMTIYGIFKGKLLVFGLRPYGFKDYVYSSNNQIAWYTVIALNLAFTFFMGYITFRLYNHYFKKSLKRQESKK